jgi:hypothetical protein
MEDDMQNPIFDRRTWSDFLQVAFFIWVFWALICPSDAHAFGRARSHDKIYMDPGSLPLPGYGIYFGPIIGTRDEISRVRRAEIRVNELIWSQCFERFFMTRGLVQTNGLAPEAVINQIRFSAVLIPVTYYQANDGLVGYRNPPDPTIYFNRRAPGRGSDCFEASNAGHEALHVLGYGHDYYATPRRPYSVPYSWNAMTEECCRD